MLEVNQIRRYAGRVLWLLLALQDPEYLKAREKIEKIEVRERMELAAWAGKRGMNAAAAAEVDRVLTLDPDNKSAKKLQEALVDPTDSRDAKTVQDYVKKSSDLRDQLHKEYGKLVKTCEEKGWDAAEAKTRATANEPAPGTWAAGKAAAETMLKRLNEIRKSAGLDEVKLDDALSIGAQLHTEYMIRNEGHPKLEGLKAHHEAEDLPGYTPEGAKAGAASDIGFGQRPSEVVDGWNGTLYHRLPLLRPSLKRVGAGSIAGGKWGHVSTIDVISAVEGESSGIVAYPPDKATNIPLAFCRELPNPIPSGKPEDAGFPITLTFYGGTITGVEATLARDGKDVACWMSCPEKPATDFPQQDTICLIPRSNLASGTTYTVSVRCSKDGEAFERTWSFTTR